MGKNNPTPNRAEIRRRKLQSSRDREKNRRQEQSRQDRERNGRQQLQRARAFYPFAHSWTCVLPIREPDSTVMARRFAGNLKPSSGTAFDSLFNNSRYSDMTIYLGVSKVPFSAHRVVLGTRCLYFDNMFQSGFKEDITNEVTFEKDSPHALWRVLRYIYTGDYSDEPSEALQSEVDDPELFKHLRVFALADMFLIEELKVLACKKFEEELQGHWSSDMFPDSIREVYSTTNSINSNGIRKVVVDTVVLHRDDLVKKAPFQELVQELGDFAVDLVLSM